MGLDIYFYKVKTQGVETTDIEELVTIRKENRLSKQIPPYVLSEIKQILNTDLNEDKRERIIELIDPYVRYEFDRRQLKECAIERVEYCVNEILDSFVSGEDMYYRKVNFLYAYFADRLEEEQCIVTLDDCKKIIKYAETILETRDTDLAAKLLPTQSGFFFGSTEYDDYYFDDVRDVLEQFSEYIDDWTDDTIGWVYFSW
jgi:hypothetical protein